MGERTIPWLCSKLKQHPLVPLSGNLVDRHRQQSLGDLDASTLRVWLDRIYEIPRRDAGPNKLSTAPIAVLVVLDILNAVTLPWTSSVMMV